MSLARVFCVDIYEGVPRPWWRRWPPWKRRALRWYPREGEGGAVMTWDSRGFARITASQPPTRDG